MKLAAREGVVCRISDKSTASRPYQFIKSQQIMRGGVINSNINFKRLHSHADRSTQTSLNHPCASRSDRPPPRTYLPAATGILQPRSTSGRRAKRHMTARSPILDNTYPFLHSRRSALAAYHLLLHEFDTLCRELVIET